MNAVTSSFGIILEENVECMVPLGNAPPNRSTLGASRLLSGSDQRTPLLRNVKDENNPIPYAFNPAWIVPFQL